MKLILQILLILFTLLTSLVNATPVFTKVVLPAYVKVSNADFLNNGKVEVTPQSVFYNMEISTLFP